MYIEPDPKPETNPQTNPQPRPETMPQQIIVPKVMIAKPEAPKPEEAYKSYTPKKEDKGQ